MVLFRRCLFTSLCLALFLAGCQRQPVKNQSTNRGAEGGMITLPAGKKIPTN